MSIDIYIQFADIKKSWPEITVRTNQNKIYLHNFFSRQYFKYKYEYVINYDVQAGVAGVWIISPKIIKNKFIHMNSNSSLCLYDPKDYPLFRRFFLGSQIVTWTHEWINNYEVYLVNGGTWIGSEARHM